MENWFSNANIGWAIFLVLGYIAYTLERIGRQLYGTHELLRRRFEHNGD